MGLAEPKKRRKISHDPRNLAWSSQSSTTSYGHRLMTQQGWSEGQALGTRTPTSKGPSHRSGLATDAERLAAARVGVLFKDDNLGLGAKRKAGGQDVEGQRMGLDAFQGLLGRLNGKSEDVLMLQEKKVEERRLEMYARGRWGGMVFVKGGILVGSVGDKEAKEQQSGEEDGGQIGAQEEKQEQEQDQTDEMKNDREERRRTKEEKRQRKEERRKRKEDKALRTAAKKSKRETREEAESDSASNAERAGALPKHKSPISQPPDEPVSSAPSDNKTEKSLKATKKQKRKSELSSSQVEVRQSESSSKTATVLKNGRHLLRGRNIQAKKMVFADAKGLDQIFMR